MALHLIVALEPQPSPSLFWLAVLLTYLAHSAIWGAASSLLVRWRAVSSSTQAILWLAALLGPVVTTSFAAALPASFEPTAVAREIEVFGDSDRAATEDHIADAAQLNLRADVPHAAQSGSVPDLPRPARAAPVSARPVSNLLALFGIAALLGCLRFVASLASLWWRLRARTPVTDRQSLQRLAQLRSRIALGHVALTESAALDVPLVLGGSEICVPLGSLSAASVAEIDAVLAHELAHLERRDGVVFPLVGLVQLSLWLHPLNHWLASRFRHAAELACDDRAVELTGDPLGLAHALARVASSTSRATRELAVPAMARPRSANALVARVRRLVDTTAPASCRNQRWAAASLIVIAVATASLSVRAARAPLPQPAFSALSALSASEQIASLMRREQQLQTEIERLTLPAARSRADSAVRILELQQQLRHVRETAGWVERNFLGEVRH